MILQIGYGLAAVVCLRRVFPGVLMEFTANDPIDIADLLLATILSCLLSLAWPLVIARILIYHFLLEPIVKEINRKNAGGK